MARQTVKLTELRDTHYRASRVTGSELSATLTNTDGSPMTPEQAYRAGLNEMMESALRTADRWRGWMLWEPAGQPEGTPTDGTRRHFFL